MYLIRDAYRSLRAAPTVSAIAILSLALGIGANTAMFSILDRLILRSLPVEHADQLAMVGANGGRTSWTNPIWEAIRDRSSLFDGALAWSVTRFNLAQSGQVEFVDGLWASGSYFDVLGVRPILGRTWQAADDRHGGGANGPVAVISYRFWQQRYGGAADVLGQSIVVERVAFTIIGVTPPDFFGLDVGRTFDVAIPIGTETLIRGKESSLNARSNWWLNVIVRRKAGQSLADASAAMRGIQPEIRAATLPTDWRAEDLPIFLRDPFTLDDAATGDSFLRTRYRQPLVAITFVVGLVLVIACANIANLLLARATARRHELSVRLALGASRPRLVRQLLGESLVLAGLGAALGLVFAGWFSRLLVGQLSTSTTNVFLNLTIDWRILSFTTLVACATALLFGTAPALHATRVQPNVAIREHGRGGSHVQSQIALGNVLVVVQVALSLALVVAAGLFVRTFAIMASRDIGFDRDPVLIASVNAQSLQLDVEARRQLFQQLRDAAASVPGVASAALSNLTPVAGGSTQWRLDFLDGQPIALGARERGVFVHVVTPDFLRTYGTRLLDGRNLSDDDRLGAPTVILVNEAFARRFTGGANPVGRRVREPARPTAPTPDRLIVGYVADAAYRNLRDPVPPTMYLAYAQQPTPGSSVAISVRTAAGSPMLLATSLTSALTQVNPRISITLRPLSDQVSAALTQERLVATLSGFFGGLALLLAGLGLYGVTSYAVNRRRTEIGIRLALGAQPRSVVRMVLGRVAVLVAMGVAIGATASWWGARFVAALLYGLTPRDAATFVGAALVVVVIGGLAGLIPAVRAARIDPARVLRQG
jgi:putative ABC transport system permease protein